MDAIQAEIARNIGRRVRLRVGDQDYIGAIDSVDHYTVQMTTGSERPVQVTLRTEAIDAVMVFV